MDGGAVERRSQCEVRHMIKCRSACSRAPELYWCRCPAGVVVGLFQDNSQARSASASQFRSDVEAGYRTLIRDERHDIRGANRNDSSGIEQRLVILRLRAKRKPNDAECLYSYSPDVLEECFHVSLLLVVCQLFLSAGFGVGLLKRTTRKGPSLS